MTDNGLDEIPGTTCGTLLAWALADAEMAAILRWHRAETGASRAAVAREIGISSHMLEQFLSGAAMQDEVWNRIAAWCEGRPVQWVEPEEVAISLLTRWTPGGRRREARSAIARAALEMYRETGTRLMRSTQTALERERDV